MSIIISAGKRVPSVCKRAVIQLLKRLSRYYDTPIDYDENIAQLKCNGKLVLFDNLEDVMKTIYNTIPIKYSQKADRILVQKK